MRKEKQRWQGAFLALLTALTLVFGQIPIQAFAGLEGEGGSQPAAGQSQADEKGTVQSQAQQQGQKEQQGQQGAQQAAAPQQADGTQQAGQGKQVSNEPGKEEGAGEGQQGEGQPAQRSLRNAPLLAQSSVSAPANLRWDGTVAKWDAVDGAALYELTYSFPSDDNPNPIYTDTNECDLESYMYGRAGDYKFSVAAYDASYEKTDAVESPARTVTEDMATPANLRWEGTVAKWDAVEGASGYLFSWFDGSGAGTMRPTGTSCDLEDYLSTTDAKDYVFYVSAYDGADYDTSLRHSPVATSPTKTFPETVDPTISSVSLTLAHPVVGTTSATAPDVTLPDGVPYEIYSCSWETEGSEPMTFVAGTAYKASVTLKAKEGYEFPFSDVACDVGDATLLTHSTMNFSGMSLHSIAMRTTATDGEGPVYALPAPTNLTWVAEGAKWDRVADADEYLVELTDPEGTTTSLYVSNAGASATIPCLFDEFIGDVEGDYTFAVTALADNRSKSSDKAVSESKHFYETVDCHVSINDASKGSASASFTNSFGGSEQPEISGTTYFPPKKDSSVTLTATEASGFAFKGWYSVDPDTGEVGSLKSVQKIYTFTATESANLRAVFVEPAETSAMRLVVDGNGRASAIYTNSVGNTSLAVTSNSIEIDAAVGTEVRLLSGASSGSALCWWEVHNYNTGAKLYVPTSEKTYTFTMGGSPTQINAKFVDNATRFSMTGDTGGSASVSFTQPDGTAGSPMSARGASTAYSLAQTNTTITFKAEADEGYAFWGWYEYDTATSTVGNYVSSDVTYAPTADREINLKAKFAKGIDEVDLAVTAPDPGTQASSLTQDGFLSVPADDGYSISGFSVYDQDPEFDGNTEPVTPAFTGTFEAGKTYYAYVPFLPDEGRYFLQGGGTYPNTKIVVDGAVSEWGDNLAVVNEWIQDAGLHNWGWTVVSFTPGGVTVDFDTHGADTATPPDQVIAKGGHATQPADPEKQGFHFKGWYEKDPATLTKAEVYGSAFKFADTAVNDDLTLHAAWYASFEGACYDVTDPGNPVKYGGGKVTFATTYQDTSDPTSGWSSYSVIQGSPVTITAHPNDGFQFIGWSTTPDASGLVSTGSEYTFTFDEATTLYGLFSGNVWEVTFDGNGGTGEMAPAYVAQAVGGTEYTLPKCTFQAAKMDEQAFDCWEVNGERKAPGENVTITQDTTVKALWKDITDIFVFPTTGSADTLGTVTLDGAALEDNNFAQVEPGSSHVFSIMPIDGYAVRDVTVPSQMQDDVTYEYDSATGGVTLTTPVMEKGSYLFFVETAEAVTVSFDAQGGSPVPAAQVLPKGDKATKPAGADVPVKDGWSLLRWYDSNDADKAEFDFDTAIQQDTTLKAAWAKSVNVKVYDKTTQASGTGGYYMVDGYGMAKWTTGGFFVIEGEDTSFVAYPDDGHMFLGWCDIDTASPAEHADVGYADYVIEDYDGSPTSLTAVFAESVDVSFDANGGSPTPDTQTIEKGTKATTPENVTKENLSLLGWFEGTDFTADPVDFSTKTFSSNTELTAGWYGQFTATTYDEYAEQTEQGGTIALTGGSSGSLVSISRLEGAEIEMTATPADNYRFAGWAEGSPTAEITITEPTHTWTYDGSVKQVYAIFVPTATVTFDNNGGTVGENWWSPNPATVDKGSALGELLGRSVPTEPPADIVSAPAGKYFDGYEVKVGDGDSVVLKPGDPISIEISAATTVKYLWRDPIVTLHWSSLDGEDLMDPIQTQPVPAGSTMSDALATIDKQITDKDFFEKDGYEDWGYRTHEAMRQYDSYEAMFADEFTAADRVSGDVDVYVDMVKKIDKVQLSLDEQPACGTEVTASKDGDRWSWETQSPAPQVSLSNDAAYAFDKVYGTDVPWCFWLAGNDTWAPFVGTFEGGNDYPLEVWLRSSFGYTFADDIEVGFDGTSGAAVDYDGGYIGITAKATAVHVPGDPVKEHEVAPTCTEPGSYELNTYCTACGDPLSSTSTTVAPLGHEWGEWKTTKAATTLAPGEETRTCDRCEKTETREVPILEFSYSFVKGDGATWVKGSKDALTFQIKRSDADDVTYERFTGFTVDGAAVPESAYTKSKGSVVAEFNAAYLETLSTGEHTIKASFEDSDAGATATFTVKDAAAGAPADGKAKSDGKAVQKTGDALLFVIGGVSLVALVALGIAWYARRRSSK